MAATTRAGRTGISARPGLACAFIALPLLMGPGAAAADGLGFADRFVRLDGALGAVEVGQTAGAPARLMVTGPAAEFWPTAGIGSGEAVKAAWFASPMNDLRVGVSYSPAADGSSLGDARHVLEGAVRHAVRLGGATLDFTVGGVRARARNPVLAAPLRSLMSGAALRWQHLTFGAAVREQSVTDGSRRSWSAGLAYDTAGWGVHGQMARTLTGGQPTSGGWNTRVRYVVLPGIAVTAALSRSGVDDETTVMRLGTRIRF